MRELSSEEKVQLAKDSLKTSGREDFLFGRAHESEERLKTTAFNAPDWAIAPEITRSSYEEGWQEAEAELQRDGPILLYLHELLRRMEHDQERSGEWFGYGFDEPIFLLKRALAVIEQESRNNENTSNTRI